MSFGENLIALRNLNKLSRKELADKLNIPYTTLRNYETNQREPGHKLLIQIAQLFSVSVDTLIGVSSDKKTTLYSNEAMEVARYYDTLGADGKQRIREAIKREQLIQEMEKKEQEIQASMQELMRSFVPLQICNTPIVSGVGIDLEHCDYTNHAFSIPANIPDDQAETLRKLKGNQIHHPLGIRFHYPDQKELLFIVDQGKEVAQGDFGLFTIDGTSYLGKILNGQFFVYPEDSNPSQIPPNIKAEGTVVGYVETIYIPFIASQ